MKNFLIKLLTSFYKRFFENHKRDNLAPRILVVSTTGLGDTLWATPALKALKRTFPKSHVIILTSPIGEEILKHNPYVDEISVLKRSSLFSLLLLFPSLRRKKIQTALIFHISQRPLLPFCLFLGASEIIGTEKINKGLDFLLTKSLPHLQTHEIQRRLNIVMALGAQIKDAPLLEFYLSKLDEEEASVFLQNRNILSYLPIIGIHPGSKDAFKRWPPSLFIQLAKRLKDHLGCQLLITGNLSERPLVEKIASNIPGAIPITGELSLGPLAALIKKMSLFITNDTGPMHVAFAMQTPTIGLFTPTHSKLCGPFLAPQASIIQKSPTCTPCLRKKCKDPFCLLQISVDEVFDTALNTFYAKATSYV